MGYVNMSKDNLQTSNESIQEYIKELRKKQLEGQKQIEKEEAELKKTQGKITQYKEKEIIIKNSLAKKKAIMDRYTKAIKETEGAYMKILENSKTLLHVIKRENQTVIDKDTIFSVCHFPIFVTRLDFSKAFYKSRKRDHGYIVHPKWIQT